MLPAARTPAPLLLPLLLACGETPFCTTATYAAPRTGLTIAIGAQGTVPSGADLAEVSSGYARLCPTGSAGAPLDLSLPSPGASVAPDAAALSVQLASAGYTVDPGEVAELSRTLAGALAGPKGTWMSGQTSALHVLDVAPRYERCDLPVPSPCPPRPGP